MQNAVDGQQAVIGAHQDQDRASDRLDVCPRLLGVGRRTLEALLGLLTGA